MGCFTIRELINFLCSLVGKNIRINLSFSLWSLWLTFKFYTSLICCLLWSSKFIVPSFNIHYTSWSLQHLFLIVIKLLDLHLLTILRRVTFAFIFLFSLFLDKKGAKSPTFLSGGKIILKQLIKILIINRYSPLLVLEVFFWSPLFLNLCNILLNWITVQRIHHWPKEITLWKSLLFAVWVWQIIEQLRQALDCIMVTVFDAELRPGWYLLGTDILL